MVLHPLGASARRSRPHCQAQPPPNVPGTTAVRAPRMPTQGWADGRPDAPTHALLRPQWSEDVCAAHLTQRDGYQATTQGQLKEQLYQEIIHYFDKGKVRKKKKCDRSPVFLFGHLPSVINAFSAHDVCGTRSWLQIVYRKVSCMLLPLGLLSRNLKKRKKSVILSQMLLKAKAKNASVSQLSERTEPVWGPEPGCLGALRADAFL